MVFTRHKEQILKEVMMTVMEQTVNLNEKEAFRQNTLFEHDYKFIADATIRRFNNIFKHNDKCVPCNTKLEKFELIQCEDHMCDSCKKDKEELVNQWSNIIYKGGK